MNDQPEVSLARTVKAAIVRRGLQRTFARRLIRAGKRLSYTVIASPWLSTFEGKPYSVERLAKHMKKTNIPCYVITRPPRTDEHLKAVQAFQDCPPVELIYNRNLHAKIYACVGPSPCGFAILGSANLTVSSLSLHEIGLIVLSGGGGDAVVRELADFGVTYLRTRPESRVIKKRQRGR